MFKKSRGARSGVTRMVVLITDGNAQDDVVTPSDLLKSENIVINVVGVGNIDVGSLHEVASKPSDNYTLFIDSFDSLNPQIDVIVNQVKQCDVSKLKNLLKSD